MAEGARTLFSVKRALYILPSRVVVGFAFFRKHFPHSPVVSWLLSKLRRVSGREYKNTVYNILTGYGYYQPPSEIKVPRGCYYNPYTRGMVTTLPPFLKDNMLEYEDGVKASTPQMAFDLAEFLSFLDYGRIPDRKFDLAVYTKSSLA